MVSVFIFGTEYLLRIWASGANEACGYHTLLGRRLNYIFSFTGLIDLIAILPSILPLIMGRWICAAAGITIDQIILPHIIHQLLKT